MNNTCITNPLKIIEVDQINSFSIIYYLTLYFIILSTVIKKGKRGKKNINKVFKAAIEILLK